MKKAGLTTQQRLEREIKKKEVLLNALSNRKRINKIAENCNSSYHDDRYCSACEDRKNAIEEFIEYIEESLKKPLK